MNEGLQHPMKMKPVKTGLKSFPKDIVLLEGFTCTYIQRPNCVKSQLITIYTCLQGNYRGSPAYRGIRALRSPKPIPRSTAVRAEGSWLLTEESEGKARRAGYLRGCTRLIHQLSSWTSGVLQSLLLTLQSTVVHLRLWKHRLR